MARPQNSPKGLFYKAKAQVEQLTVSSTTSFVAVTASGAISGATLAITGTTELPAQVTLDSVNVRTISNSTGVALQINTTGSTWAYFSTTSVQPT